ncbi:MAG: NADH-quinone oxidoreductase subunit C [Anaerolineae bacterium]|nr:NADH-quinone oxidoreductase subunit C [Anaerolineae bacterium]
MTLKDKFLTAIAQELPELDVHIRDLPMDETFITIPPEYLKQVAGLLMERCDITHLSTITGLDNGTQMELLYHFWYGSGITLHMNLPYLALQVDSLTDIIPGARMYEREVHEMLGISFSGLTGEGHLFLPDDWTGAPPLRKGEP